MERIFLRTTSELLSKKSYDAQQSFQNQAISFNTKGKNIMKNELKITYEEKPEEAAWGIIGRGVGSYNKERAGENNFQRLCYVLQDTEGEVVGGILGETYWEWFYLDLLWVAEDLRRQGYGSQLLEIAEEEARRRGAKNAYLDTFSFQAPQFYFKNGYQVFGELNEFPPGSQRYFLQKGLQ
jgi:GNAT superfamily N-acetyltransferase